jgi:hypothetical protein
MKKKKSEIKDWTEPAHLELRDWFQLKKIKRLYEEGDMKEAMNFATFDCDTVIREEIPPHIWVAMGGTLTKAGEEKLRLYQDSLKSKKSK